MKSETEQDDLLELSRSICFVIRILCPDGRATARLGRATSCKVEKRYSPEAIPFGKGKMPSSGLRSNVSVCRPWHIEHWLDFSLHPSVFKQCTTVSRGLLGSLLTESLFHTHA